MNLVIDIKNKPKKDDILVFNGSQFECISKYSLTKELVRNINTLYNKIDELMDNIEALNKEIKILKGEE